MAHQVHKVKFTVCNVSHFKKRANGNYRNLVSLNFLQSAGKRGGCTQLSGDS